jgi:hypothetical protein
LCLLVAPASATPADCPPEAELTKLVESLDRGRTSRVVRFGVEIPSRIYRKAVEKPGRPVADRDGEQGFGVVVAELPIGPLWKAINDEDHHAIAGGYFPVEESEVIEGTPRGTSRVLFQYFERWGIGRWWATRMVMNESLYEQSNGKLWELWWVDATHSVDTDRPPVSGPAKRLRPIVDSHGSWLFAPLAESCTLIEFYTWSDPGGALGATQGLVARRTIRQSLTGVIRLATEHIDSPHPDATFVRPDGSPMGPPPSTEPPGSARAKDTPPD